MSLIDALMFENNVFELPSWLGDEISPSGVSVGSGVVRKNPYTFFEMIARGNVIGTVDERYGALVTVNTRGVLFDSCQKALVEENVMALGDSTRPIDFFGSGTVKPWYNLGPDGQPIRAFNRDIGANVDDISDRIQEAQTLAFL